MQTRAIYRYFTPGRLFMLALLVVITIVSGAPYFIAGDDAVRPPSEQVLTKLELPLGRSLDDLVSVEVHDVVDGDTIDVLLDGRSFRVRYYGVDTPERGDRCYREAADRNESLVGKRVLLLTDARDMDSFGRLLRYVFLEDGTSVDATLVAEGFAHAWRQDGRYRGEIIALEQEAQSAGRGCLW